MRFVPLLVLAAGACRGPLVPAAAPVVTVVAGSTTRVAARCARGRVEMSGGVTEFGGKAQRDRAFGQLGRGEPVVRCVDDGETAETRLQPLLLRALDTRVVKDAAGARVVLAIDGQGLGPYGAPDDGVYLVWPSGLVRVSGACPEQRADRNRVVACATAAQLAGRGPAHVRVQSAGRLAELAGAPVELGTLL